MAFVNEYIREEDIDKYDLLRICGEHNLANKGHMFARDWTVDHEREMFLLKTWTHRESEFEGDAFYWRGTWMFFDVKVADGWGKPDGSACWFLFQIKSFSIPAKVSEESEKILKDLQEAFTARPGGMTFDYVHRSAAIEFIKE
jgi:hypothetical protein